MANNNNLLIGIHSNRMIWGRGLIFILTIQKEREREKGEKKRREEEERRKEIGF